MVYKATVTDMISTRQIGHFLLVADRECEQQAGCMQMLAVFKRERSWSSYWPEEVWPSVEYYSGRTAVRWETLVP